MVKKRIEMSPVGIDLVIPGDIYRHIFTEETLGSFSESHHSTEGGGYISFGRTSHSEVWILQIDCNNEFFDILSKMQRVECLDLRLLCDKKGASCFEWFVVGTVNISDSKATFTLSREITGSINTATSTTALGPKQRSKICSAVIIYKAPRYNTKHRNYTGELNSPLETGTISRAHARHNLSASYRLSEMYHKYLRNISILEKILLLHGVSQNLRIERGATFNSQIKYTVTNKKVSNPYWNYFGQSNIFNTGSGGGNSTISLSYDANFQKFLVDSTFHIGIDIESRTITTLAQCTAGSVLDLISKMGKHMIIDFSKKMPTVEEFDSLLRRSKSEAQVEIAGLASRVFSEIANLLAQHEIYALDSTWTDVKFKAVFGKTDYSALTRLSLKINQIETGRTNSWNYKDIPNSVWDIVDIFFENDAGALRDQIQNMESVNLLLAYITSARMHIITEEVASKLTK